MKNIAKKAALTGLILLYGFVICLHSSAFSGNLLYTEHITDHQTENYNSVIAKTVFCQTTPSETSINVVSHVTPYPYKNQLLDFAEGKRIAEQILLTNFTQYNFFSKYLLLRLSRYAIIYPFHYFW